MGREIQFPLVRALSLPPHVTLSLPLRFLIHLLIGR